MKTLTGITIAAALIASIGVANAQATNMKQQSDAQAVECTEMGMTNANGSVMKMSDATKKTAAMKEMGMAKDMMAKKDMTGCKMHMNNAMGMMK